MRRFGITRQEAVLRLAQSPKLLDLMTLVPLRRWAKAEEARQLQRVERRISATYVLEPFASTPDRYGKGQ